MNHPIHKAVRVVVWLAVALVVVVMGQWPTSLPLTPGWRGPLHTSPANA